MVAGAVVAVVATGLVKVRIQNQCVGLLGCYSYDAELAVGRMLCTIPGLFSRCVQLWGRSRSVAHPRVQLKELVQLCGAGTHIRVA